MSASAGVAAPVGAVSRKVRQRAARTSLRVEGASALLLTAVPGRALLQRSGDGRTWETVSTVRTSRFRRTRIDLPGDPSSPSPTFRVVFSPKNGNLPAWVSQTIDV